MQTNILDWRAILRAVGRVVVVILAIPVALILILLLLGAAYSLNWERRALPDSIVVDEVLHAHSESGFREGCVFALYQLDPAFARRVRQAGVAALGTGSDGSWERRHAGNPYGAWRRGPVPNRDGAEDPYGYIFALGAVGCPTEAETGGASDLLRSPTAYYRLTRNREGLLLVEPRTERALYLYFG